jgi:hypothetical protein
MDETASFGKVPDRWFLTRDWKVVHLDWAKSKEGEWFDLDSLSIATEVQGSGVYFVWTPGRPPDQAPAALKVGRGNLSTRLYLERWNPAFRSLGHIPLFVTWAVADESQQPGIVQYLTQHLSPLVHAELVLGVEPVAVNLPLE